MCFSMLTAIPCSSLTDRKSAQAETGCGCLRGFHPREAGLRCVPHRMGSAVCQLPHLVQPHHAGLGSSCRQVRRRRMGRAGRNFSGRCAGTGSRARQNVRWATSGAHHHFRPRNDPESGLPEGKGRPQFHRLFAPTSAHTTAPKARDCRSCHANPAALGYGRGQLKYVVTGRTGNWQFTPAFNTSREDGLPLDAWIGFLRSPGAIPRHAKECAHSLWKSSDRFCLSARVSHAIAKRTPCGRRLRRLQTIPLGVEPAVPPAGLG